MTSGQRPNAVKTLLAHPHGLPGNRPNLAKPVGLQCEGNLFIKNTMLKSDVLDLNGANHAASKL
jgi:hypothetical protein